jgi:uncharacterized metal-binding protein YceD (DUF177 family)
MSIHGLAGKDMDGIFSRNMKLGGIGAAPVRRRITATEAECTALAELFGLTAIAALSGDFTLTHGRSGVIEAQLRLEAQVTQICAVSLEPFDAAIVEDAALRFVPAASVREGEAVIMDAETLEGPDEIPYQGEMIDLGAVLAEQLALALDPYPRKPGASSLTEDMPPGPENPFAALHRLRKPG